MFVVGIFYYYENKGYVYDFCETLCSTLCTVHSDLVFHLCGMIASVFGLVSIVVHIILGHCILHCGICDSTTVLYCMICGGGCIES